MSGVVPGCASCTLYQMLWAHLGSLRNTLWPRQSDTFHNYQNCHNCRLSVYPVFTVCRLHLFWHLLFLRANPPLYGLGIVRQNSGVKQDELQVGTVHTSRWFSQGQFVSQDATSRYQIGTPILPLDIIPARATHSLVGFDLIIGRDETCLSGAFGGIAVWSSASWLWIEKSRVV